MNLNRRDFLFSSSAFFLAAGCRTSALFAGAPRLKFGVVSDIHVTTEESVALFEKSLRIFKNEGVDAVMVPGDLTDWGLRPSFITVKNAWDRVFAGTGVVPLFCTGNHDYDGWAYSDISAEMRANGFSKEERLSKDGEGHSRFALAKAWTEVFGTEFAPVRVRTVKGYDFISSEWENTDGREGARPFREWMAENGARFRGRKPFFVFQHAPMKGTTPDGNGWADKGDGFAALKDFPNAIAFTGHSHVPFNDERSIWQGEFTAIATPSLSYAGTLGTHENSGGPRTGKCTKAMPRSTDRLNLRGGQGYLVSVYEDGMTVERLDLEEDGVEGAPAWVVPFTMERPYALAARAGKSVAPEFPAGAVLRTETRNGDNRRGEWAILMDCRFPAAVPEKGARVYDYELKIIPQDGSKPIVKRYVSPAYSRLARYEPSEMRFFFDTKELPVGVDSVIEARAYNCYGKASRPIVSRTWHPVKA